MSQENVEIVRRALRASRSEFAELLDPTVRLDLSERVFNPAVYDGYEGIMRWTAEVGEIWVSYVSEADSPPPRPRSGDARRRARALGDLAASAPGTPLA